MAGPSAGVRLSFITQVDQSKYESLFTQASVDNKVLSAVAAKDVLSRSNLGDDVLAQIWDLSNVTSEPQLTFPEFAVAMYLTSMKMTGKDIPNTLPPTVREEIETAVAMIKSSSNQSNISISHGAGSGNTGTSFPGPSSSMLSSLAGIHQNNYQTSMMTGQTGFQPQPTGYQQSMPTGLQVPMITGVTPMMASNPQVAMPTGMLGNNLAFANRMMPHETGGRSIARFQSLSENVKIPWAVTIEEKKQYAKIFKAWDTENKGTLSGDKAKEIFSQSGLPQNVLMQIWNLSDPNNQGKLNLDEFAVAMHLIYRKLNGYPVPETLPTELVPPSTRDLKESVNTLKQSILENISRKKNLQSFGSSSSLSPPSQSPQRSRSTSPSRHTKPKYTDDDESETAYVSSARRMGPDRSRWAQSRDGSPNPSASRSATTSSYTYRSKATRVSALRKELNDNKNKLKMLEEEIANRAPKPFSELSYTEQKDIEDIKKRISELQDEITKSGSDNAGHLWDVYAQKTAEFSELANQEKSLQSEVDYLIHDVLKNLVAQVRETEEDLAERKKQLIKQKEAKAKADNGAMPLDIVGTGPNGEVTESDRIRAKAKAMIAAKMGKITGKTSSPVDFSEDYRKIEEERAEFCLYADSISDALQKAEDDVSAIRMETSLIGLDIGKHHQNQKKIEERTRFETGKDVSADLKAFILELSFAAATASAPDVDPTFESRFPEF
ncbi:uncharacterized protein BYT42DRAFT_579841 [Radiomyces spectabilis]|uniref:uncharacterized protein n=1 Tax=Radiomyces spectabilis TaxID=64574 RepID=UPI00221FBEDC|nr:uncharacterized protein BYT42DRAFT_579841 [Radiomyces spectabilis]KAI8371325.1 hypothetical protein BYT42DRAFT_579841 [Radiomyces spectabilis]